MTWTFGFPDGSPLVSGIGPEQDNGKLRRLVEAYAIKRQLIDDQNLAQEVVDDADRRNIRSAAFSGVLRAADTAQTVLVEHHYYDLDSRSEDGRAIQRQFKFSVVTNDRLHFFSSAIDRRSFEAALTEPEARESLQESYLGYSILRQDNPRNIVGRTMLRPPQADSRLRKPAELRLRVRTRVKESLTLAGIPLEVEGVPFIQQDGGLTRCAHAAAWMAHYTSVLRGLVPRVAIGEIHPPDSRSPSLYYRQYPSPGLTDVQLVEALANAGLPPEVRVLQDLSVQDRSVWYHRPELFTDDFTHWHSEAVTTTVCRYLNSGMPVLIAKGDHVQLICGYLRASHFSARGENARGGISHFILSDDQVGPYQIVDTDAVLKDAAEPDLLLVPLPPALALPGDVAEYLGAEFIRRGISDTAALGVARNSVRLQRLMAAVDGNLAKRRYAVRTYASDSTEFKQSFLRRCAADRAACTVVSMAPLPKYVWTVELVDRKRRPGKNGTAEGPVIGEVVLDATAIRNNNVDSLLLHLPGAISIQDSISGYRKTFECQALSYPSGRWAHDAGVLSSSELNPRVSKTCGVYRS